ncbi:hypothetical protein A3L04_08610 [Thermococcus chitonophagus]|uniref:Uncharacterized protein n=1 Tax=Thermococcus chitonophagus TaxID=54262 RepID=A0A2Z2N4X9_9EURY|nr:hypothetical protein A3L04_08610 [Thermococcus chitonophagus]
MGVITPPFRGFIGLRAHHLLPSRVSAQLTGRPKVTPTRPSRQLSLEDHPQGSNFERTPIGVFLPMAGGHAKPALKTLLE